MRIKNMDFKGNIEDISMILVSAERYALGRQTYIVDWTINVIQDNMHLLTDKDLSVMIRDISCNIIHYCEKYEAKLWTKLVKRLEEEQLRRNDKASV